MNILRRFLLLSLLATLSTGMGGAEELELVLQAGHSQPVSAAVWVDNQHLLSGSEDGSLKLWNSAQRRVRRTLWPPLKETEMVTWGEGVQALLKTEEGTWALYRNGRLRLWNPLSGELKRSLNLPDGYSGKNLGIVADSSGALYVYGRKDEVLKIANQEIERIETLRFSVMAVSADGSTVAGVTHDGIFYGPFGNLKPLPETFANRWGVDALLLSAGGERLSVASGTNWVEEWDLANETIVFQVPANDDAPSKESLKGPGFSGNNLGLTIADFGPDSLLVVATGGEAVMVDRNDGSVTPAFTLENYGVQSVAVRPDRKAVSGGYTTNGSSSVPLAEDSEGWTVDSMGGRGLNFTELEAQSDTLFLSAGSNFVLSYDLTTGQPSHTYHTGYFPATLLGRDTLYCGGNDGILYAFNIKTGEKLWEKALTDRGAHFGEGVRGLALSPDGRQIAVSLIKRRPYVVLVNAETGEIQKEISFKRSIASLNYSRDGRKLYLSDYSTVQLYDIGYAKVIHSWKKTTFRSDQFVSLLNHPTREALLGLTRNGMLYEFNPADLEAKPSARKIDLKTQAYSMRPVGANLIVAADQGAALIDTKGQILKTYGHHLSVTTDALVLDKVVITTGWDSQVLVWDKETGRELATLISLDLGKNWLFVSSDFHFDGTEEAQALIEWRWNGKLYELERFFERFYQPGLLARTINLSDSTPKPAPVLGKQPPKVKLLPPKELGPGLFQVDLKTEAELTEGVEVRLYHNGHRVSGTHPYKIKAVEGENRLRASAYNKDRTVESEPDRLTFFSKVPTPESTLHVFAAAVNDYPNRLDFAVQDAQSFVGAFEPGLYDKVNKVTLYDEKANKATIVKALKGLKCEPQDTLLIFLAGHGTIIDSKFHFIPHGADGKSSETSLSSAELGKILAGLPATRQVLFLDTCHAGASAKDLAELLIEKETPLIASQHGSMLIKDQKVLARQAGTFLVAGSTPNATAAEVPELGHGLFTYAVLNGLQGDLGKDHEVTVNELLRYLSEQVPELSMKFRGSRHGIWQFSAGQDFPIAKPK
jgi:WD40 repeat protein